MSETNEKILESSKDFITNKHCRNAVCAGKIYKSNGFVYCSLAIVYVVLQRLFIFICRMEITNNVWKAAAK